MWDLPGPGIELGSPALAGRFFTTEPPGKPSMLNFKMREEQILPSRRKKEHQKLRSSVWEELESKMIKVDQSWRNLRIGWEMEALVEGKVDESNGTRWFCFCPFFKKQQLEGVGTLETLPSTKGKNVSPWGPCRPELVLLLCSCLAKCLGIRSVLVHEWEKEQPLE